MSVSDTDREVEYRTATELLDDEPSNEFLLEEGDLVRVHDVHYKAPILYPEARIGRVWGVKFGTAIIDLLDGFGCEVTSVARPISELEGVIPRDR